MTDNVPPVTDLPAAPKRGAATRRHRRVRYIEVFFAYNKRWYWRLLTRDGQIAALSERFDRRGDAVRSAHEAFPTIAIRLIVGPPRLRRIGWRLRRVLALK